MDKPMRMVFMSIVGLLIVFSFYACSSTTTAQRKYSPAEVINIVRADLDKRDNGQYTCSAYLRSISPKYDDLTAWKAEWNSEHWLITFQVLSIEGIQWKYFVNSNSVSTAKVPEFLNKTSSPC